MEKYPNFFIVGAPKAGTTSLYEYLKPHPQIFMSPQKEPYYFCKSTRPENWYVRAIKDKKDYLNLFKDVKDEKIVGEASIWYLSDPDSPKLIREVSPRAFILISLRDPVNRAYSHYTMQFGRDLLQTSFHDQLQIELNEKIDLSHPQIRLEAGLYYDNVKKYLDMFGKEQVKIILFEELIKNPEQTIKEVLTFLKVEPKIENFQPEVYNPYKGPRGQIGHYLLKSDVAKKISRITIPSKSRSFLKRKVLWGKNFAYRQKIKEEDRKSLIDFYNEDVEKTQNLLGHKLPWPNFKSG